MENAKGNELELGLSLSNANKHVESSSNTNRGAGANANANANSRSRLDTIVGHRPLTELVWSTQNGLSIKCAGCSSSFAGMKPCNLKDVGPTQKAVSPSQGGEQCVIARPSHYVGPSSFLGSTLGQADGNIGAVNCVHFVGKEKECISTCKSIPVGDIAGTSEGPKNQRTADLLPLLVKVPEILKTNTVNIGNGTDIDIGLPLKMHDLVKEEEGPVVEKIEETAENDVIVKDAAIVERDGKGGGEDSWREDEGESMESCNSASKKNKRWSFEQQWNIGSKRVKKQRQECGVVKQQDSSFMNWISNMVKGVKPYQEEGHTPTDEDDDDDDDDGDEKTSSVVKKSLGFQSVFHSLYSQDTKRLETKAQMESSNSKEIILFDKTTDDISLSQKAFGNSWITRLSPKTPSTSNNNSSLKLKDSSITLMAAHSEITCFICGKTGHESRDCLRINENTSVSSKKKVSHLNKIPKHIASTSENNMLNEEKSHRIPKEMFDTIRRLRLSRTDILKWMNSHLEIANLDGYFLRLRLAKREQGLGGAGYYVACITDENPSKGSKKPIRVNIGGVQCLVECRYISNCDFLEDELIAWWRTTLTSGRVLTEEDLISKLEERKKLGF